MPRDTRTGGVLESMILPALTKGGYSYTKQVNIGPRLGGGRHVIDVLAEKSGIKYLISSKWQQSQGTAEEKVPFEIMCLAEAILENGISYKKAYLVLGGTGWKRKEYYLGGGLQKHLIHADKVNVLSLEEFVGRANRGLL